jgi:hypothetical protein
MLKFLGHIWMLPNAFFTVLWLWLPCILGWIKFKVIGKNCFIFVAVGDKFFAKWLMRSWAGFAPGGPFIILRGDYVYQWRTNDRWRTILHEQRHVQQQMVTGIFHFPIYFLMSCFIWLFLKSKHAYYDNWFEIDARREAGQRVYISRDQWRDPDDRWSWW